eukprot:SAG31_NODE_11409_length_1034_cov_1.281283_1_plen_151_part_00
MFMYVGTAAGVAAKQVVDKAAATVQDVDVASVQSILTDKFNQIIHLPGPPAPPGPSPPYYNVSGAGSIDWNGQYIRVRGSESSLMYKSTSKTCSNCSLYSNGGTWRLAIRGKELFYVAPQPSALPPLAGWGVDVGKRPAPHLAAGGIVPT